jgi:hypothetical protein
MTSYSPLFSFKRVCNDDMGSSLQLEIETFWSRNDHGSSVEEFLLAKSSTRCSQVHQILHLVCYCQAINQEIGARHPSAYSR